MIKLLSDENFDGDILRGLHRRLPEIDLVRVLDAGLGRSSDPNILAWAAIEERILLTHDRRTVPSFAYDRIRARQPMPGVFLVSDSMSKGQAIDELVLAVQCLESEDCKDQVMYFPL